ncbi:MAG: polysaccharide deacetylase family protein [Pseudomonas sp.]|nr:polysaccharide deacetylase family protein [Pseudomonas sp.]
MMVRKVWHTPAAISWLQALLAERFGQAFDLQLLPGETRIVLRLPGDTRFITLALDGATFSRADSDLPCAQWNAGAEGWQVALPGNLPAPGVAQLPAPLIIATDSGWHIGYDILGLTYWMLTRQEEVGRTDLDGHGRFPAAASHAYKNGYLHRPIVDEWLLIVAQAIKLAWPALGLKSTEYSLQLTHDVDSPARYGFSNAKRFIRSVAGDLIVRKSLRAALRAPSLFFGGRNQLHPSDPLNTFDWIMDRSEEYGLKSAFYFICGRTDPLRDALYDVDDPAIRKLIRRIHNRGHEIGLHPSFGTFLQPDAIAIEAAALKRVCAEEGVFQSSWGGRMHFLRWKHPETMRAWDDAGMHYDSTLGYPETPGFRCGTCIEYQAFDPVANVPLRLRIRPLVAMDVSVIADQYLGLGTSDKACDEFYRVAEACRSVGGTFALLWHNCQLETSVDRALFLKVLDSATRTGY